MFIYFSIQREKRSISTREFWINCSLWSSLNGKPPEALRVNAYAASLNMGYCIDGELKYVHQYVSIIVTSSNSDPVTLGRYLPYPHCVKFEKQNVAKLRRTFQKMLERLLGKNSKMSTSYVSISKNWTDPQYGRVLYLKCLEKKLPLDQL